MTVQPIPTMDLRRGGEELDRELEAAFRRVLRSGHYINGPEVAAFEKECADYLGVRHAIGVSSGTDALLVALMALGIGPGDEVVCPTYTFFATAGAVARLGAKPVFVDSCPRCFNLDVDRLEAAITPRTKAIVPVHLFGQCADMDRIVATAGTIPVIEDAAQAIGASFRGRRAGGLGRLACFSFFPSKNLGAFGDGGLVATDDEALASRIRRLRVHGAEPKYFHDEVGGNFRLDELQAALLRVKLPRLDEATARRQAHASAYDEAFADVAGLARPQTCSLSHVYNQYVVRFADEATRTKVQRALSETKISTAIYYPRPLHLQACFASLGYGAGDFPVAERLADETLALPMFPELRVDERDRVATELLRALALPA